jgi:hypothetical protein
MSDADNEVSAGCRWRLPNLVEPPEEQPHGDVPVRLDEALKYAVAQVEKDPRSAQLIVAHFGWNGQNRRSVDELSAERNVPPKQIQRIVARTVKALRDSRLVPEAVTRSIDLANRMLPIVDVELCEALLQARLCYVRFSCSALVAAAEIFGGASPFEEAIIGESRALVQSGNTRCIKELAELVRYVMQTRGCANTAELAEEFRGVVGGGATRRFSESVGRSAGAFEWLDQEDGWFWYVPGQGGRANPLLNCIKQVLAVTPRVELSQLQLAIGRVIPSPPPLNVLAAICKRLLFVRVQDETIIRVPNLLVWDVVKKEAIVKKLVRDQGSVRGWLSDGRLFVAWKLDQTTLQSGVLRVHEPMNSFIEGDYELVTLGNDKLSNIQIRQRACWDTRPLLEWLKANAGDTLVLIFDRLRHRATGILGDDEFVAQVA